MMNCKSLRNICLLELFMGRLYSFLLHVDACEELAKVIDCILSIIYIPFYGLFSHFAT